MSNPDPPGGKPTSAARAQTLPLQGLVNRVNRGLLRTPLLCRLVGRRLLTMYLVGRKSGRHYAVPVACTRRNGTLLVGTQFAWARNLRAGEPVHIRLPRQAAIRRCPCRGRRDRRPRAPGIDGP
jgi:hypothetical protein